MAQLPFGYEIEDQVATITLGRPDRLNALTFDVYRRLADTFYRLRSTKEVKAVVITGGGKGFCSGGDVHDIIGQLLKQGAKEVLEFARMTGELIENIRRLDKPVIAAINGTAAGAGAVIALACDLRIMAGDARIHFLFTKVGLTGADMGAAWLLPRIVGLGRATEWLLLGDGIAADTALQAGLVTRLAARSDVLTDAQAVARRLAKGPSMALSMTKRMLNSEASMDLSSAIEAEALAQAVLLRADDHRIFYEAFSKGEEPEYKGR